jgi:hypothetical protein
VLGQGALQLRDGAAGLDGHSQIRPGVFDDLIHASSRQDDIRFSRRIAPVKLRSAAARDHCQAGLIGAAQDGRCLALIPGLDNYERIDTRDGIRIRGDPDVFRPDDRAHHVSDTVGLDTRKH